jgi:predicted acyl esterase
MRHPAVVLLVLSACHRDDSDAVVPDFTVRPGVELATVLDASPGTELTLYDDAGTALVGLITDDDGQANFAYVPDVFTVIDSRDGGRFPIVDGGVLRPGDYEIRDDATGDTSGPFHVPAIDDVGSEDLYAGQTLVGVGLSPLSGDLGDPETGYQYVEMRDGVTLGAMVRFPDPQMYGQGPWPTVIEYSGYSPSRPDQLSPGTQIANAMGYAVVSVNMRGTGCSGGVFDVFNRAQHADGYDIVETVARQDWVLNHRVGMVGLSYPGISQLYVGSTAPPSLAAIVPQSVIGDAWEMQWPGGVYNAGFTRQWVSEREAESAQGGSSWVTARIDAGDATCADNVRLSTQNIDFESFLHGLEFRPRDANDRDLTRLVTQIEAPVFLSGGWQDEQTGAMFGEMLDQFTASPHARFVVYNGRHPDGYGPDIVARWYEFLEFYVAGRIPRMNLAVQSFAGAEFAAEFGYDTYQFADDRFTGFADYDAALAAYEAEPPVRALFEVGAAPGLPAGVPTARFEADFDTWPAPSATPVSWSMADGGALAEVAPADAAADTWTFDPDAAADTFFGPSGYSLLNPLWDLDWQPFAAGDVASYVTPPFAEDTVLAGPGIAHLWVSSPEDRVQVQVTLSEVRSDGIEVLVQSGWLDLRHRAGTVGDGLRIDRTYSKEDAQDVIPGEWMAADVQIPAFAQPFRAGSQLRVTVSSPGRNEGTWAFEAPDYAGTPTFELGRGGEHASSIEVQVLPGIAIPAGLPACPSLRGQPCRTYEAVENVAAE